MTEKHKTLRVQESTHELACKLQALLIVKTNAEVRTLQDTVKQALQEAFDKYSK